MKQPILYSFVRFRPYIETGEFVNVGLLMCEPKKRKLTYRLVEKNDQRVTQFFSDNDIFKITREVIDDELRYITSQEFDFTIEEMARFFHHYVDVKEGTVQYSNATVGVVEDPQSYFDTLYSKYIHINRENNAN